MSTVTETLPADIAPIAGPLLLGYLFNWGLYGVLSVQVYLYHLAFPKDSRVVKALVYSVFLIETTQTVLVTHDAFNAYAKGYGNIVALGSAQLEWLAVPIFSGIVSATVQMYYAYRVSVLSGSRVLGLGICLIALLQGSSAVAQGAQAFKIGNFADLATEAFASCTVWLAGSAACDVIIAGCMTFLLLKNDTKMPATHAVVTKLVRLIVETGMLTAVAATIDIILFLAFPHNSYHGCVALTLAKLYSNSLLVLFNSRIRIVGGRNATYPIGSSYSSAATKSQPGAHSTFRAVQWGSHGAATTTAGSLGGVHVQEESWIGTDPESIQMEDQSTKKPSSLAPEV
ncbi:uncharacterized protein PHACADRAFT_260563 [Phanerochaete carnosa HHB-10118-sp]|uniref:DUF6534 domain-containing protein n=1 Tax=Phanerochaete carnosa (strain HHB-10118-sp) TaxID=650164 RepID=K5WPK9_PHACS|nr:uncharacterized protein PHACADRAFT_260563 [Phanerochaete carnosa HHB-10118-sp]EKM52282.1 hypothetical protein PHACADRAFT_260563 [Phanerochaete carnosa HHB-10118-sp]